MRKPGAFDLISTVVDCERGAALPLTRRFWSGLAAG